MLCHMGQNQDQIGRASHRRRAGNIKELGTKIKPEEPYMRVLGTNTSSSTIRPSENYRNRYLASRHIV